jgi:hypothetical protein
MVINFSLKNAICSLFEVHADEGGVQRIVTPLEYPGTNDPIVVRVRPSGEGYLIDENGEAAFNAGLNGGDIESEAVSRWVEDLASVQFSEDESLTIFANDERLIAPYIFRIAEAAQQLHAIATARSDRQTNDFKERIGKIIRALAAELGVDVKIDEELPIAGGLKADYLLGTNKPLIVIAATSPARLLEAEVVYMQYREEKKSGYVLAVAESQAAVGKKQYERAAYYTNKTVIFNQDAFGKLLANEMTSLH